MISARTVVIAGAGIGGLTAALALAQRGFRVLLFDQAERLEETGAGLQLSPNATRVLMACGLGERLRTAVVPPLAIRIRHAPSGDDIARVPLGPAMEARYGAPYWVVHRGDLQAILLDAVQAHPDITLDLGVRVEAFANHADGVSVKAQRGRVAVDAHGVALIGADGLWSSVRAGIDDGPPPRFTGRVAWRAVVPAEMAAPNMREPFVQLWLGNRTHLVHYPVKAGEFVNIVAVAADPWQATGWSAASAPDEVLARFAAGGWSRFARDLLGMPERWLKWALCERAVPRRWGVGRVTLLGDAAHPMLPFLAQGAAMAIEDAAVLAERLAAQPTDPAAALRLYEGARRARTQRMQRAARRNGKLYHYYGPDACARNLALRIIGGERLRDRYNWIYDWRAA